MKYTYLLLLFTFLGYNSLFAQEFKPTSSQIYDAANSALHRLTTWINYFGENKNKATPETKERYLDAITDLFEEGATMEVSSTNRKENSKPYIRQYFNNLIHLGEHQGYRKVIFSFSDLKIKPAEKDGNNRYLAIGEYTQTFRGELINGGGYGDITTKYTDIHIYIQPEKGSLFVKFGNTKVFSTKPLEIENSKIKRR